MYVFGKATGPDVPLHTIFGGYTVLVDFDGGVSVG